MTLGLFCRIPSGIQGRRFRSCAATMRASVSAPAASRPRRLSLGLVLLVLACAACHTPQARGAGLDMRSVFVSATGGVKRAPPPDMEGFDGPKDGFQPLPEEINQDLVDQMDVLFQFCSDKGGIDHMLGRYPLEHYHDGRIQTREIRYNYGSTYVHCTAPAEGAGGGNDGAKVVMSKGYGGWPGGANSAVPLRSMSKVLVGAAVLALHEAGHPIGIDTRVGQYFECGTLENATVGGLLGMAHLDNRHKNEWAQQGSVVVDGKRVRIDHVGWPNKCDVEGWDQLQCVMTYVCPAYAPDAEVTPPPKPNNWGGFEYDNFGYTIVDAMVERATGHYVSHWIAELLLRPLKLRRTLECMTTHNDNGIPGCYGIPTAEKPFGTNWDLWNGGPLSRNWVSNAIITSPRDLGIFLAMLVNNGTFNGVRVLSQESVDAIFSSHNPIEAFKIGNMGLGMVHSERRGNFWGWGGSYGTRTNLDRDTGVSCVVFANMPAVKVGKDGVLSQRAYEYWYDVGRAMHFVYGGEGGEDMRNKKFSNVPPKGRDGVSSKRGG